MRYIFQHEDKREAKLHVAVVDDGLLVGAASPMGFALVDLPDNAARQLCDALNKHFDDKEA